VYTYVNSELRFKDLLILSQPPSSNKSYLTKDFITMAFGEDKNDQGVTGAAKFVTSTLGNTVGAVTGTLGGVVGGKQKTLNSAITRMRD